MSTGGTPTFAALADEWSAGLRPPRATGTPARHAWIDEPATLEEAPMRPDPDAVPDGWIVDDDQPVGPHGYSIPWTEQTEQHDAEEVDARDWPPTYTAPTLPRDAQVEQHLHDVVTDSAGPDLGGLRGLVDALDRALRERGA